MESQEVPLRNLLCRLGVCQEYIHAFMQMLEQMQRRFEIAGHLGPPTYTTTGIVEGCGVAVACMLAVAILCYKTIEQKYPPLHHNHVCRQLGSV